MHNDDRAGYLMNRLFALYCIAGLLLLLSMTALSRADSAELHKTLVVTNAEPVKLAVEIYKGDVEIAYSRDGEVRITASAVSLPQTKIDANYFQNVLRAEQAGNKIVIQTTPNFLYPDDDVKVRYRIDVPYRTEISSSVKHGKQNVRGVTGPVELKGSGDAIVSYVSQSLTVELEHGNIELQMIGDHVAARTGGGNIAAERLPKGIRAETEDGDVKLLVVGPSEATVRAGSGRVEVGGARDTLAATTDAGDIRVQAVPHADWSLNSNSGSIRLELPSQAPFDLEGSSDAGNFQFDREDLPTVPADTRKVSQKINGGGRRIEAHTGRGAVLIR